MIVEFNKYKSISIVSSNEKKIREYKQFGLDVNVEKGLDLPEVDGNMNDVIIYKSLLAGTNKIVEDTILEVDGVEINDIRWKIKQMNKNASAKWIVSLGLNDGEYIRVYRGIINGELVKTENVSVFGFDDYFIPEGSNLTLAKLDKKGQKSLFSARRIACENLIEDNIEFKKKIDKIPEWKGNYQNY